MAEQARLALAGRQQAGQHLHGGAFAAAVGAQKAKNLATPDAKADVVHGHEVAKAHGQALGLDGDVVRVDLQRRDEHRRMAFAPRLGQQRDEGRLQRRSAGAFVQFLGRPGGENPPRVHRHQPVEAFSLLHVGGGDHHAHARTGFTDMGNQ